MGSAGNGSSTQVEPEAKLSVPADFLLPDLGRLIPGTVAKALPELHLDAVHYDTGDLRLARAGITVRHRTGEHAPAWRAHRASPRSPATTVRRSRARRPHAWVADPARRLTR
jgi:hypothetical protein